MNTQNSEILAEFSGYDILSNGHYQYESELTTILPDFEIDWSWLMKIVEKIESLENNRYAIEINQGHCNIYDMVEEEEIISIFSESKIKSVNTACLDFVKIWNNKNVKNKLKS